jgi:hypothetical protein
MKEIVQSVILKKSHFTREQAKKWVHKHGFKPSSPDVTPHYYRFRQHDPHRLEAMGYHARNTPLGKEGYLVIFYP